jgi:hypothetical protein
MSFNTPQTRNIVIAPCGNKSYLFSESWLKYKNEKDFDVCLMFYHDIIEKPEKYGEVDYFFHLKGFKYHMLYQIFTTLHPEWLDKYDYFYFLDDDIEIDTRSINRLFSLSRLMKTEISCASLTQDSFCCWPIFKQNNDCFCRFVGQIEVMSPLFSSHAVKVCMETFIANKSSWGIDSVWSSLLGYPKDKLIVFDDVTMRHTLPVGKGELYVKVGVNTYEEWIEVTRRFNAKKENYREYGRLQKINGKNSRFIHFMHISKQNFIRTLRRISDYDINSRIVSRRNKFFKKIKAS